MTQQQPAAPQPADVRKYLPQIIVLLFAIQPLMDVLSFWLDKMGNGNFVSLLLRFAFLAGTVSLGFWLSRNKKVYILLGAVIVLFAGLHIWACASVGYHDPFYDLTNYIRVIQIPLMTFCFITFLRESGTKGYRAMERGFLLNFVIIIAVELISTITGTDPHTYANKGIGVLGWFSTTNAQSAILSALVPIVLMQIMRKKSSWKLAVAMIVSFGALYLFATRLTYFAIFVCAAGLILVMVLSRKFDKRATAILLVGAVICGVGFFASPVYRNQAEHLEIVAEKQQRADEMIREQEEKYDTTVEESPELCLLPVYEEHLGGLVDRFGAERVMAKYGYTSDMTQISGARLMKINYCKFLMEDVGIKAKLFGLELADMIWDGETYDVENDFHGIYFLYGIVGFSLFALFLLYFAWLILRALVHNFKKYFTMEAGAFGISLCLLLAHVYCTAGVLRRPNASFYLSVILAAIYYFVKIKVYNKSKKPKA